MTADSNGAELREGVSAKTDELASQLLGKALDVLAVGIILTTLSLSLKVFATPISPLPLRILSINRIN